MVQLCSCNFRTLYLYLNLLSIPAPLLVPCRLHESQSQPTSKLCNLTLPQLTHVSQWFQSGKGWRCFTNTADCTTRARSYGSGRCCNGQCAAGTYAENPWNRKQLAHRSVSPSIKFRCLCLQCLHDWVYFKIWL